MYRYALTLMPMSIVAALIGLSGIGGSAADVAIILSVLLIDMAFATLLAKSLLAKSSLAKTLLAEPHATGARHDDKENIRDRHNQQRKAYEQLAQRQR